MRLRCCRVALVATVQQSLDATRECRHQHVRTLGRSRSELRIVDCGVIWTRSGFTTLPGPLSTAAGVTRTHAADDPNDPPAGHRPRLPAAQAPGAGADAGARVRQGHVFYPEATAERARRPAARRRPGRAGPRPRRQGRRGGPVRQRPALRRLVVLSAWPSRRFGSALGGRCERKPELAASRLRSKRARGPCPAAAARHSCARCSSRSATRSRRTRHPLDEQFPGVGRAATSPSRFGQRARLSELLTHLYVLIPVLDDEKHYWVGDDEVEKLLRHGEGWLAATRRGKRSPALPRASARLSATPSPG